MQCTSATECYVILQVSALCGALQDKSVLVSRATLDVILALFPLHRPFLPPSDLILLLSSALLTLLRRDMSLNRRLYSWLLGTQTRPTWRLISPRWQREPQTKKQLRLYTLTSLPEPTSSLPCGRSSPLPHKLRDTLRPSRTLSFPIASCARSWTNPRLEILL
jgi:hypothetical protein